MAKDTPATVKECVTWASEKSGWKHEAPGGVHKPDCGACTFERLLAHNIRQILNDKLEKMAANLEEQGKGIDGAKSPMHDWQKTFVLQIGKAIRMLKENPASV